jgi:hypothetical protein
MGFCSIRRQRVFPLTAASILAVRPTKSLTKWIPGAVAMGIRWQWCTPDQSPLSNIEVKNMWCCTSHSTPHAMVTKLSTGTKFRYPMLDKTGWFSILGRNLLSKRSPQYQQKG